MKIFRGDCPRRSLHLREKPIAGYPRLASMQLQIVIAPRR